MPKNKQTKKMTEDNKELTTEPQQEKKNSVEVVEKKNLEAKTENDEAQVANGTTTEPPKEVKSIGISGFGGLKFVKVLKKPEPAQPKEGEVLIRVKSAGLGFNDLLCRQGSLSNLPKTPFILGFECAGVVEAVGENVDLKVGDHVAALSDTKCWSELALVDSKYVFKLPENIDFDNAVALTLNYVVAYYLLFEVGNLRSGQSLLIHNVGGGVGQALVQLASTVENVTIIGTASKNKHEKIEKVNHLFDHLENYVSEIKKISPGGVNLVLDCLYGDDMNKGYGLLKPLGHYIIFGSSNVNTGIIGAAKFWWQVDKIKPMKLFEENKTVSGFNLRQFLFHQNSHDHVRQTVEKVYNLFLEGKIKPVIDSRFAFEDVVEAMQKLHERKNIGKIVLDPLLAPKPKPVEEEQTCKKSRFGKCQKKDDKKVEKENGVEKQEAKEEKEADKNKDEKVENESDVKEEKKDSEENKEKENEEVKEKAAEENKDENAEKNE